MYLQKDKPKEVQDQLLESHTSRMKVRAKRSKRKDIHSQLSRSQKKNKKRKKMQKQKKKKALSNTV